MNGLRTVCEAGDTSALADAVLWLGGLVTGSAAASLAIIGIAIVEVMMLTGRLDIRTAFRLVLSCFILLGAPVVSSGFLSFGTSSEAIGPLPLPADAADRRAALPPAAYYPYARSLLSERLMAAGPVVQRDQFRTVTDLPVAPRSFWQAFVADA